MIVVEPYDDDGALAVFQSLDHHDLAEAAEVRGAFPAHLILWAEWRAMRPAWIGSWLLKARPGARAFAVLALSNTGQAGVAQAAFLSRDHARHRAAIGRAAVLIRRGLPGVCADLGVNRVECRCSAAHPTASTFLVAVGFGLEADMPGFGPDGGAVFRQFAYRPPQPTPT